MEGATRETREIRLARPCAFPRRRATCKNAYASAAESIATAIAVAVVVAGGVAPLAAKQSPEQQQEFGAGPVNGVTISGRRMKPRRVLFSFSFLLPSPRPNRMYSRLSKAI